MIMLEDKILVISSGDDDSFLIHFQPQSLGKTEEELLEIGVLFESVPDPVIVAGKDALLMFDGTNLYYEYVDIPLTLEEQLAKKDEQITELKVNQFEMNQAVEENSTTTQQLLELLDELEVIS